MGGAGSVDYSTEGDGFLAALTFDDDPQLVNFARYGNDTRFHGISALKRHSDGNILFAGCAGSIAIILWAGGQFHILTTIDNIGPESVTDISYQNSTIYAVSGLNRGLAAYFDHESYLKDRDQRHQPRAHGNWRSLDPNEGSGNNEQLSLANQYRSRDKMYPKYANEFRDYSFQQITIPDGKNQIYF